MLYKEEEATQTRVLWFGMKKACHKPASIESVTYRAPVTLPGLYLSLKQHQRKNHLNAKCDECKQKIDRGKLSETILLGFILFCRLRTWRLGLALRWYDISHKVNDGINCIQTNWWGSTPCQRRTGAGPLSLRKTCQHQNIPTSIQGFVRSL